MTRHWNEQQEQLAIQWAERAICYTWLHNESANDFNRKKQYIGIPNILTSSMAGIGNAYAFSSSPPVWIQVGNMITTSTAAFLATLNSFLKYAELAESHRNMSKEFAIYSRAIATQLSFPNVDRENPKEFLIKYQQSFDDLIAKAPHIPDHIIKRFTKTKIYEDESFAKPLIVNALEPVVAHESMASQHQHLEHSPTSSYLPKTTSRTVTSPLTLFRRTANEVKTIGDISRRLSQDLSAMGETLEMDSLKLPRTGSVPVILNVPSVSDSDSDSGSTFYSGQ